MPRKNNLLSRLPIVSPPPSAGGNGGGGTELDAALAHLRPAFKRLLPNGLNRPPAAPKAKNAAVKP